MGRMKEREYYITQNSFADLTCILFSSLSVFFFFFLPLSIFLFLFFLPVHQDMDKEEKNDYQWGKKEPVCPCIGCNELGKAIFYTKSPSPFLVPLPVLLLLMQLHGAERTRITKFEMKCDPECRVLTIVLKSKRFSEMCSRGTKETAKFKACRSG